MTASKGMIASGYFMLGFPTETREEMLRTVDFALKSPLHNAYFFKFTDFLGYQRAAPGTPATAPKETDLHFFAPAETTCELSKDELNEIIMAAQRRFYMNPGRILRGFATAPVKSLFIGNSLRACALILLAFLSKQLRIPVRPRSA